MRPVVVLSHDIFDQRSGTVITLAVTRQPQHASFPLTMELKKVRLPKRSWVKISQVRPLSVDRLGRKLGCVTQEELDRLVDGLNEIVGGGNNWRLEEAEHAIRLPVRLMMLRQR